MYGGLVLIKLNLKNKEKSVFEGVVHLRYRTAENELCQDKYEFKYETPEN
jgi:hypothetical protein